MQTDKTFRVRIPNKRGMLAQVVTHMSSAGVLFSDIKTRHIGRKYTYRDITVEVTNDAQGKACLDALEAVEGIVVDEVVDEVLRLHEGGKLVHRGRYAVKSLAELREVYTPGVAKVCMAIKENPGLANKYTNAGNTVAVVSNGSRVLGLGDLGPLPSLPVMESKALFYGQFVGLNAVPLVLDAQTIEQFVDIVCRLEMNFAGIHLEDIRMPDCIEIERQLIQRLSIPVMHDDQHGTAVVALAAMQNMTRAVGRHLSDTIVAQVGLGAAGLAIASLAKAGGAKAVVGVDPNPAAAKYAVDYGIRLVSLPEALQLADLICLTTGRAGLLKPEEIRPGQIILALSNPIPEIEPDDAIDAGAAFAADGRTVNNLLCYPGLFKGAIAAGARWITTPMKLAAARIIASSAEKEEILPDPLDRFVHERVADSVEAAARGEPPPDGRSSGSSPVGYVATSLADDDERACHEND